MRNYERVTYGDLKTCFKCGNKLPYTEEYFYKYPKGINKLMSSCKSCCIKSNKLNQNKKPKVAKEALLVCKYGHPLVSDNIIATGKSKGRCKTCRKEAKYKNRHKKSANRSVIIKTHCKNGHPLIPGNLRKGRHAGSCLICHRFREAKHFKKEARNYIEIILNDPCVYCGQKSTEIDHIEPRIKGGSHEWDNLAPVCKKCNTSKHKRGILVFMLDRVNKQNKKATQK